MRAARHYLILTSCHERKVVLTAAEKGMNGAVAKAVSIAQNMEGGNAYILGQFDNPTNPKAHRYVTARHPAYHCCANHLI